MNKLEYWIIKSPINNSYLQDLVKIRKLQSASSLAKNKVVLEIGCGNGNGSKNIFKRFSPKKIVATDLDQKMVDLAKSRNTNSAITFELGDATKLKYKSNSFDAIFSFGVIHHIPNWEGALVELKRVLKPGGELLIEDLSIETFTTSFGKVLKIFFDHPYKQMFSRVEFLEQLKMLGFEIKFSSKSSLIGLKYFIVVAKRVKAKL